MIDFLKRYWKWILLVGLILVGMYVTAWYYFNVVKKKNASPAPGSPEEE